MTLKEQFDKNKVEYIYDLIQFEGSKATKEDIIKVQNREPVETDDTDITIIDNLIKAMDYIENFPFAQQENWPDKYLEPANMQRINGIVGKDLNMFAGHFRIGTAGVTTLHKHIEFGQFNKDKFLSELKDIAKDKYMINKVVKFIIFSITEQPFYDGNKRTAFLTANSYLLNNDLGTLLIKKKNINDFNKALSNYYENKSEENYAELVKQIEKNFVATK